MASGGYLLLEVTSHVLSGSSTIVDPSWILVMTKTYSALHFYVLAAFIILCVF